MGVTQPTGALAPVIAALVADQKTLQAFATQRVALEMQYPIFYGGDIGQAAGDHLNSALQIMQRQIDLLTEVASVIP